jgi:steroid delta-isomerase-like uncharacterized protein
MSFHEGPIRAGVSAYYRAISSGDLDVLGSLIDDDFIDRDTPTVGSKGDLLNFFASWREGFPDIRISIDLLIVASDSNWAAASTTTVGTHGGIFFGIPATGKSVSVKSFEMMRWENGRITERSGLIDALGLLQQIGVLPPAG